MPIERLVSRPAFPVPTSPVDLHGTGHSTGSAQPAGLDCPLKHTTRSFSALLDTVFLRSALNRPVSRANHRATE